MRRFANSGGFRRAGGGAGNGGVARRRGGRQAAALRRDCCCYCLRRRGGRPARKVWLRRRQGRWATASSHGRGGRRGGIVPRSRSRSGERERASGGGSGCRWGLGFGVVGDMGAAGGPAWWPAGPWPSGGGGVYFVFFYFNLV